jgi:cytochrome b561
MIEGLLLVALLAAAVSGAAWVLNQGTDLAMAWRDYHVLAARTFTGLLVLHVLAVASHLLDFLR